MLFYGEKYEKNLRSEAKKKNKKTKKPKAGKQKILVKGKAGCVAGQPLTRGLEAVKTKTMRVTLPLCA